MPEGCRTASETPALSSGVLRYCRVCHPYPLIYRQDRRSLEHLEARGGFFLGMFPDATYTESAVRIDPGDLLFVYTDGITETMNSRDELYGRKRLESMVLRCAHLPPGELLSQVRKEKDRFAEGRPSQDDISLFALRRAPA